MKPTNYKDNNCTSQSSNCVVYDGNSLACVGLCSGDSVSETTYKLAKELCAILDQLDINNYDLQCLGDLGGTPPDFKAFINLLIFKVCSLNGTSVSNASVQSVSDCPNCIVNLAPYFQFKDPSTGDTVTKDLVQNYVQKIGLTVGDLVGQINVAQRVNSDLSQRVTVLENKPTPTFKLPDLFPTGIASPTVALPLDEFTGLLEKQFVSFRTAVGNETAIYNAITTPPSDFNAAKALGTTGGVLGTLPGWVEDPKSLSDSTTNVWLTIEDLRSAVVNIQSNIKTACNGIEIDFSATLQNKILKLFFNGIIPTNLDSCQLSGSLFKVMDSSGNYFNIAVDIKNNMNNSSGVVIDLNSTSLNFADDLKVSSVFCFADINTGTTCQNYLETLVNNNFNCPILNISPGITSVDYNFTHTEGTLTYSVQLFNSTNEMVQSRNESVTAPTVISGTFSSLSSSSLYRMRVQMITASNTKTCPLVPFNTLANPCPAPNNITAIIE